VSPDSKTDSLVFDQHPSFRVWLCKELDIPFLEPQAKTIAVVRDRVCGVVAYQYYNGHDMHILAAGHGVWLNRNTIKVFFRYPFIQMGCRRVTVLCRDSNEKARNFVQRLGFVEEGTLRQYFEDGADCIVYGLLKEECRYLGEENGK
jgi:RimJ/RimL family protein N-acetyltransferase